MPTEETRIVLFVGSSVGMQRWLSENRRYAGRDYRILLAINGPEHLRGLRGPIKIVHERGWLPPDASWAVDQAITQANHINGQLSGEARN